MHVELPPDLAARLDPHNASLQAARLIALELFRKEKVSLGLAARFSATPLAAFMDFAAHHDVPRATVMKISTKSENRLSDAARERGLAPAKPAPETVTCA